MEKKKVVKEEEEEEEMDFAIIKPVIHTGGLENDENSTACFTSQPRIFSPQSDLGNGLPSAALLRCLIMPSRPMRVILDSDENSGVLGVGLILARTLRRSCQRFDVGGKSAVRSCPVVLFDRAVR